MDFFDLLVKITANSDEYNKALDEAKTKASSAGDTIGKVLSGAGKIAAVGIGVAAGGITALSMQSLNAYKNYEQLVGGVQKLYGNMGMSLEEYAAAQGQSIEEVKDKWEGLENAQNTVLENANQAYKTVGMSANDYMEVATSFSAALINDLDDMEAAADRTDLAMRAIGDNVNTFGTNMDSVSNAFMGFAKQNYTMLDNLKLGYGGTKEEMERLIEDANEFANANGMAADLTIDSFADIVTAIDLIQQKQGIAGTTAREAATTIEGSLNMLKGAWTNLVAGFSNPDADLGQLMDNLVESAEIAFKNILPAVEKGIEGIAHFITEAAPMLGEQLPTIIEILLPAAIEAFGSLMTALAEAVPELIPVVFEAIQTAFNSLFETLGVSDEANAMIENLSNAFSQIKTAFDEVLPGIQEAFDNLKEAFQPIVDAFTPLVEKVQEYVTNGGLMNDATTLFSDTITVLGEGLTNVINLFADIITGISDFVTWLNDGSAGAEAFKAAIVGITTAIALYKAGMLAATIAQNAMTIAQNAGTIAMNLMKVAQTALNLAMSLNPIGIIVAAIAGLVAAVLYLWNTNEDFRNFVITMFEAIKTVATEVVNALVTFFTETLPDAIDKVITFFKSLWESVVDVGTNIVEGIWNGISGGLDWIKNKISGWVGDVLSFIKNLFGIHSPSTVMRDLIGTNLVKGIVVGIEKSTPLLEDAMSDIEDLVTNPITANGSLSVGGGSADGFDSVFGENADGTGLEALADAIVSAFVRANITVEYDDRELGRLVRKLGAAT